MPDAKQLLGDITIKKNNIMELSTKTRGWMVNLILYLLRILGNELYLYELEFVNPLEMLYDE